MSKAIHELDDLYRGSSTPNLDEFYSRVPDWRNEYNNLFTDTDYFIVSHRVGTGTNDYIAYKVPVNVLEYVMHTIHFNDITSFLSSKLSVDDTNGLMWKKTSDLNLNDLASRKYINYQDLVKYGQSTESLVNGDHWQKSIPLCCVDGLGELATKNKAWLGLSALAYVNTIRTEHVDSIDHSKIDGLDDLALSSEADLHLGRLARKNIINLSKHSSSYGETPETAHITGLLDINYINGYERPVLSVAGPTTLGGVKLGYQTDSLQRNYALSVVESGANHSQAFVNVPWSDQHTEIENFSVVGGVNRLTVSFDQTTYVTEANSNTPRKNGTISTSKTTVITPQIANNVVLNSSMTTTTGGYANLNNYIAMFSTGSTSTSVKIKECIKINPSNTTTKKFLSEAGSWKEIPQASATVDGLMTKDDYNLLRTLKSKNDEGSFYTLPTASSTVKGGVKIGINENATVPEQNTSSTICVPVRMNAANEQLFVRIPNTAADILTLKTYVTNVVTEACSDTTKISETFDGFLDKMYPIGAIYLSMTDICPIKAIMPDSVWIKLEGRYLLGSGLLVGTRETYAAANTVGAGLPTHTHSIHVGCGSCSCSDNYSVKNSHKKSGDSGFTTQSTTGASDSIYGKSATVRPPAIVVNVFQRTA